MGARKDECCATPCGERAAGMDSAFACQAKRAGFDVDSPTSVIEPNVDSGGSGACRFPDGAAVIDGGCKLLADSRVGL